MEIKELEVLRAKPGEVLVVRTTCPLSAEQYIELSKQLKTAEAMTGVKFVIMTETMEVVAVQEA